MLLVESVQSSGSAFHLLEDTRQVRSSSGVAEQEDRAQFQSEAYSRNDESSDEKGNVKITRELLNELQDDLEKMHSIGLRFSVHDGTGRTIIKIVDKETDTLIREIPPEDFLDLAARLDEMVGILFDREA